MGVPAAMSVCQRMTHSPINSWEWLVENDSWKVVVGVKILDPATQKERYQYQSKPKQGSLKTITL